MKVLALFLGIAALTSAQEFEVASIRPAVDDANHDSDEDNGRYLTHNLMLKRLIATAWDVDDSAVLGGPGWLASDGWDINAKIPAEYAKKRTPDQFRQMIQNLLATRFQLAIHRQPREVSGHALVLTKSGTKMKAADPNERGPEFSNRNLHLKATNVTMVGFARRLSRDRDIAKVVVDKTGLIGNFDFELEWARADDPSNDRPPIFVAIQQQLGLKLESAKVPIQAIVIDRAEKP